MTLTQSYIRQFGQAAENHRFLIALEGTYDQDGIHQKWIDRYERAIAYLETRLKRA